MPLITIDGRRITDFDTFHQTFAEVFGFPSFYGRNMNAWIDCMTDLDDPGTGMTSIHGSWDDPVVLQLENTGEIPNEVFEALTDCAAFVNYSRIEMGEPGILMLSYWRRDPRARKRE
jgi:hypothetical protein